MIRSGADWFGGVGRGIGGGGGGRTMTGGGGAGGGGGGGVAQAASAASAMVAPILIIQRCITNILPQLSLVPDIA